MNVTGIITEYNPFHQGHAYHLAESRRITGADYVIAVMSGDFVQRGTPAMMEKRKRAQMALHAGVDLVLELPSAHALGSAEYFAAGAVSLLNGLGVVTDLCFGSEQGELAPFLEIAPILNQEPAHFREALQTALREGCSYPQARAQALIRCGSACPGAISLEAAELEAFLSSPNNILGLEYCKALLRTDSPIRPHTLLRKGAGYHASALDRYASASAVRKELTEKPDWILLSAILPRETYRILQEEYNRSCPITEEDFSLLVKYRLLMETEETLTNYQDLTPNLARRMKNLENDYSGFAAYADLLNSRDLTYTRVCRCLMHLLLGIRRIPPISYARVLGMRKEAAPLLSEIAGKGSLPLLVRAADCDALPAKAREAFALDLFASNLYESVVSQKYGRPYQHDLQKPPVML